MSTTFTDLVNAYESNLNNQVRLLSRFGYEDNFAANVLLHKISKHADAGNARSVAKYIYFWYSEGFGTLPKEAYSIANDVEVFFKTNEYAGYTNAKGQKRYFVVEK